MSSFYKLKRFSDFLIIYITKILRTLHNLPLEMHNFVIFIDKLYLKTDCNEIGLKNLTT